MDTQHGNQPCNSTDYTDGVVRQEYTAYVRANLDDLDERYWEAAQYPDSTKPLFEQIGQDLSHPSEEIREIATSNSSYVCAALGGNLMDALAERERHYEHWRHEQGEDQRFINEGMDYVSELYNASFKEDRTNDEVSASQQKHTASIPDLYTLNLPERYYSVVQNHGFTKPWYDLIDEDFSNSLREIREIAWIAFSASYIVHYESDMDRHNVQDVVPSCYQKLVIEGVFTRERKNARGYFRVALRNAKYNEEWRRPNRTVNLDDEQWDFLRESPPRPLFDKLSAESAEEEAFFSIDEDLLHNDLVTYGFLKEKEFSLAYALSVEGQKLEELARLSGKSAGTIKNTLWEIHRRNVFIRDICIVQGILHERSSSFTDYHPEWVIREMERAMEPALKASVSLDSSKPAFFPLTSPISRQPGRLYMFNGTDEEAHAYLNNYLLSFGIKTEPHLEMQIKFVPGQPSIINLPIFDKITQRLWEHSRGLLKPEDGSLGLIILLSLQEKKADLKHLANNMDLTTKNGIQLFKLISQTHETSPDKFRADLEKLKALIDQYGSSRVLEALKVYSEHESSVVVKNGKIELLFSRSKD